MGKIGVIGGTGLYEMLDVENPQEIELETPFGRPSDVIFTGKCKGRDIVFLPRHGRHHTLLPSEINYKANICALKMSGVTKILSISAVGSLKEEIQPGQMVLVDQFFDRTNRRKDNTFFGEGLVGHIQFGEPICHGLRNTIISAAGQHTDNFCRTGTYVNMEGPAFSTKAESLFYKSLGFDVVGMTNLVEAKLSREAEMCYATIAMVTDYDCWREGEESVNVDMIIETLKKNADFSRRIVISTIEQLDPDEECVCNSNLKYSLVTAMDKVPAKTKNKLSFMLAPYIK